MSADEMMTLVAPCASAQKLFDKGFSADFSESFTIANQLHLHGFLAGASKFYHRAFEQHPKVYGCYPLPEHLMAAHMLCAIKGGYDLLEAHLQEIRTYSKACYCNIVAAKHLYGEDPDYRYVLETMGNSFESFAGGHEFDTLFLKAAFAHLETPPTASAMPEPYGSCWQRTFVEKIPRRLFFFWDKNIPAEIAANFERHRSYSQLDIDIYTQQRAEAFLHDYYGSDVKNTFVDLRHPAEQADFFRPHVVYAYGGYYLDADLRISSIENFMTLARSSHEAMFSITETCLLDNGFFGAVKGSPIMAECINILTMNCHRHRHMSIDLKTGPGVFTRALARTYYRALAFGDPLFNLKIIDRHVSRQIIEEYEVSYKQDGRNWHVFQAHHAQS